MGSIDMIDLTYALPGGRVLFRDANFRVGDGQHVALVGANGTGKTTLLRVIAGEEAPKEGHVRTDGRLGFMRQFIGAIPEAETVHDLFVALARPEIKRAAQQLRAAEMAASGSPDAGAHMRYADALHGWGDIGGYDAETLWDTCCSSALGLRLHEVGHRPLATLSGGEQKRVALEIFFRSDAAVLLLDEPDNFLDVDGKRWIEGMINASPKTILYVSHDRELLARTSHRVVTLEANGVWVHPGSFATYHEARDRRLEKIDEEHRRFKEERDRLVVAMKEFKRRAALNEKFATKARSMEKRIERFESDQAPRAKVSEQDIRMKLRGGRTGKIAFRAKGLSIRDIVKPFDTEIWYGERIGVLGPNGTGKSHFVRLLAGEAIEHAGDWKLGARVRTDLFSQLHDRPDLGPLPIVDILRKRGVEMGKAMAALRRYELHGAATNNFGVLSGGQQARFQILLMEVDNPTMLLLDEPTDNLDVDSAEALEYGMAGYEGTVVAVTHDRWFMRLLDRFLFFHADGQVEELLESPYLDQ
jgi:ATPase subunit of ABC transporter with duplicated ATPase domains